MKKGFTLIELLVVIAIIGLLSSVVLASLNTARGKGDDAAIKMNLVNAISEAELFYDSSTRFAGVCATTGANVIGDSRSKAGTLNGSNSDGECNVSANYKNWAMWVQLSGSGAAYWCVDSNGSSSTSTAPTTGSTVCP